MRQSAYLLAVVMMAVAAGAQAQPTPGAPVIKSTSVTTNMMPPVPKAPSPVDFFRRLLMMSQAERNEALHGRTTTAKTRILAKIREYQALPPDVRELRLRATELRWYLTPLLRTPPAQRGPLLAEVPAGLREIAESRLTQWDKLSPQLQKEFLANGQTFHYFTHVDVPPAPNSSAEQERIADQFNQYFELTTPEKAKLLGTLSNAERAQMEKTLEVFEKLPGQQRIECVRNYAKFAGMTPSERADFLRNAASWAKMSPQDRQTWRDLVAHVPLWPPLPPTPTPPLPPGMEPKKVHTSMATN